MIITIDGPAAAGKGTLATKLSQKYNLAYFDTGMVYRAVGLDLVLQGLDLNDEIKAEQVAKSLTFAKMIKLSEHPDFRSNIGGEAASKVSALPKVRQALLEMQRNFALSPKFSDGRDAAGVVYDGRDTGTTICPNADVKIFITASSEVRAMRRYNEFKQKGLNFTYEEVLEQTNQRDRRDASRASSPMKPAIDAVVIDTSDMSIDEVFAKACQLIEDKK